MDGATLALRLALPILLLAIFVGVPLWRLHSRSDARESMPEDRQLQQQFRQVRNRMVEKVMVLRLEE